MKHYLNRSFSVFVGFKGPKLKRSEKLAKTRKKNQKYGVFMKHNHAQVLR